MIHKYILYSTYQLITIVNCRQPTIKIIFPMQAHALSIHYCYGAKREFKSLTVE